METMKKVSWGRMRICLIVLTLVLSSGPAFARIRTLQLSELIGQSDIIVIGRVGDMKKIAEVPKGSGSVEETIENTIIPERILKGKWPKGKPMSFTTHRSVDNGKQVWREDALSFPERGSAVVLFISRDHQGRLEIVNGIQGLWPLGKDGKPLGMGYSYTVEELKKEIAKTGQNSKLR
jgi:hypothetical protein